MSISQLTSTVLLLSGLATAAKYEEYILAPRSRTLYPEKVHGFNGSISGTDSLIGSAGGEAVFDGISAVTYDFGKNIAGLVSLQIGDVDEDQFIGLTYSESSLWISNISCDATEDAGMDEPYWFQPTEGGNYTTDEDHVRGGFRYLTLVHNTTGSIAVESISVHFTAMPHYADDQIANYTGYFHCDDELLNRIWYAGAYTNQLCTVRTPSDWLRALQKLLRIHCRSPAHIRESCPLRIVRNLTNDYTRSTQRLATRSCILNSGPT
jgi:hypothetical protein